MARSTVAVRFTGDTASLQRSLGDLDGRMSGLGGKLRGLGKFAALGAAGVAAGLAVIGKSAVDSLMRIEQIGAQTDAVLKSTGGAAGVTRKQIDSLAGSLEDLTSVEAESITEGQNLLLTFTKVQNKVGKGNDIFDQATKAMVDMSVAMGTDMKSASMLVGKALNDPIKGMTALTRAGVQFTDEQKKTIKSMVEMGDTAGAQKIILAELTTQFGGSAEALGNTFQGRIEKIKHQFGTLTETLVSRLMPAFEKVVAWLSDRLPAAMDAVASWVDTTLVPAFNRVSDWWATNGPTIITRVTEIKDAVETFITGALSSLASWWEEWGPTILTAIEALKDGAVEAFEGLIEAGEFVIEHWDQFQVVAQAMAAAIVLHYANMAIAATVSSATQVAAWVSARVAGFISSLAAVVHAALVVGAWALMALRAVIHAAVVAASWVVVTLAGTRGSAMAVGHSAVVIASWAGMAAGAARSAAAVAASWLAVLGPIALVAAAAYAAARLLGANMAATNTRWSPREQELIDAKRTGQSPPKFADGGVMPGPRGVHSLALVAGGETILPTHKQGFGLAGVDRTTYNINVSVAATADQGQVGKTVVEAIAAYERRNGNGWRR